MESAREMTRKYKHIASLITYTIYIIARKGGSMAPQEPPPLDPPLMMVGAVALEATVALVAAVALVVLEW